MMFKTLHAVERSHTFAARVAVRDEGAFKNRGSVVVEQMMHHTVAEVGGKHLSFHRISGNETNAPAHFIGTVAQFFVQFYEILLQIELKLKLAVRISFVLPGIIVGTEHIK